MQSMLAKYLADGDDGDDTATAVGNSDGNNHQSQSPQPQHQHHHQPNLLPPPIQFRMTVNSNSNSGSTQSHNGTDNGDNRDINIIAVTGGNGNLKAVTLMLQDINSVGDDEDERMYRNMAPIRSEGERHAGDDVIIENDDGDEGGLLDRLSDW